MKNSGATFGVISTLLFLLGIGGVLFWLWGLNVIHYFTTTWREAVPFGVPMLIAGIAIICTASLGSKNNPLAALTGIIAATSIIVGIVFVAGAEYNRLNAYHEASVSFQKDKLADDYRERAPYEVAVSVSTRSMMNTAGEADLPKSLSDVGDAGEWNALINARGPFLGYESIQNSNVPLYGAANTEDVKFCKFDKNNSLRHHGALPHNNLSRAIYGKVPLDVDFENSDVYGYCNEDKEPIVVTPLKQISDAWWGTWKYYGVATYNGKTGELDIVTTVDELNKIPGPVYPASLAATQRSSIVATEGWWEYTFVKAAGYETATSNSEVQLQRVDGDSAYVTTLRPRGASSSIVAVSEVDAGTAKPGTLNKLVVAEFPEKYYRAGNSTLTDTIRTTYSHLPVMANESFQIYEITSGEDGDWVASMGREQSVNYRAYVSKDGKTIELIDQNGNVVSQGSSAPKPDNGEGTDIPGSVNLDPTELSTLSNEELKEISDLILEELVNRANAGAQ